MSALHLQHLTAEEIRAILQSLESAMADHEYWITQWHRTLICSLPVSDEYLARHSHRHCAFGRWYYDQDHPGLLDHPNFITIDKVHEAMHDQVRRIARKARAGGPITDREYLAFMKEEQNLFHEMLMLKESLHEMLGMFDCLTGAYSRQAMFPILFQEHARVDRTGEPCSIAIVDLDHFKRVNDTYGHQIGDHVLRVTAEYFSNNLRPYDWFCRYGGEEFLICLPSTPVETAHAILDRFRVGLSRTPVTCDDTLLIHITASIGLTAMAADLSMKETICRADEALYAAKKAGRNQVVIWSDTETRRPKKKPPHMRRNKTPAPPFGGAEPPA